MFAASVDVLWFVFALGLLVCVCFVATEFASPHCACKQEGRFKQLFKHLFFFPFELGGGTGRGGNVLTEKAR